MDYVGHFEREAAAFEAAARFGENDSQVDGQDGGKTTAAWHPDLGHRVRPGAIPLAAAGDRPLDVRGDSSLLKRYFVLVPPV